ncbi:alginate export family protein [Croceicoccus hydrothermalis]|uniref:alginate export family protein n=1 Tax=Croceicoccus hydrothermalis TaxID=2867964 RepID=UPI001EFA452E|nr:alginate export family protein [Croceicoccus hydrothermalis]
MARRYTRSCILGIVAAASAIVAPSISAQEAGSFDIEGSVRARYETYRGGFRADAADADDALVLRSILKAQYQGEGFALGARLQDARAYFVDDDTPITTGDVNALELVELYAAIDIAQDASLTLGRQTIALGSRRLVGDPGFRNSTNGFTGARMDWNGDGALTAFYVLPQQRLPREKPSLVDNAVEWDREGDDLRFWGVFYQRKDVGPFTAEAYVFGLDENDRPDRATTNRHLVTPGIRLISKPARGRLDTEVEAAWQTGHIRASKAENAEKRDVGAYMVHAELGYTFDMEVEPRVALIGDLGSGDEGGDADYGRFDQLYGPRRELGPTGLYGALAWANLRTIGANVSATLSDNVAADVTYRRLWLDSLTDSFSKTGVRDPDGAAGRDAGYQLDARLRWNIPASGIKFETAAALLGKGRFFDLAPNAGTRRNTLYGYTVPIR